MNTPWKRAHERLLEQLPVRSHEQRPPAPPRQTGRPHGTKTHHRRQQIRKLLARGETQRDMASIVGISRTAVQRHLRAIKKERRSS